MMHFANPWWLLLILCIPFFVWRYFRATKFQTLRFSGVHNATRVRATWAVRFRMVPFALKIVAFLFLVIAMARPQAGLKNREVKSSGVDIMLVVDTSGSMRALDFELNGKRQNRLDVVKAVVEEFISKRPTDRIGMVVFGTEAYTQCPLTLDHGILLNLIKQTRIGAAGDTTAVGMALGVATKRLKDIAAKSKIVILLTDGVSNAGTLTPDLAAEAAASLGVKVYTIGAGTREEAPFPVEDPVWGGERIVYQQVPIDEDTLKRIAQKTGGQFFRATDTKELRNIYATIDALEKTEMKTPEKAEYEERYLVFVIMGALFFMVAVFLQEWRLRVFP
jgi:Ca-activated chloride channel family protein